jgi:hypothetical protein
MALVKHLYKANDENIVTYRIRNNYRIQPKITEKSVNNQQKTKQKGNNRSCSKMVNQKANELGMAGLKQNWKGKLSSLYALSTLLNFHHTEHTPSGSL